MPRDSPVNWQPISQMLLIASMIDGALDDTREHIETLRQALGRPHVLDDAVIDRVELVHTEQRQFVDIYARQIDRWRGECRSAAQRHELDRMDEQNRQLGAVTTDVLAAAAELRKGTIDRVVDISGLELSLQALRKRSPASPR
jgi:hypothetical protein